MKKTLLALIVLIGLSCGIHRVFALDVPNQPEATSPGVQIDPTTKLPDYTLLAPLPLDHAVTNSDGSVTINIANYIPDAVKLIIALATGLAVLMLIYGGFRYISTAIPQVKLEGKDVISNALIGLLLITAAYSILYTLNPKLVQLSLTLSHIADGPVITGTLAAGTGSPSVGDGSTSSTGNAPAGTNSCGTSCVPVTDAMFPSKGPGGGTGSACTGQTCFVNPTLGTELSSLDKDIGHSNWAVTELTPPSGDHNSTCHTNGTCVDAALAGTPTPTQVTNFLDDISKDVSQSFQYEVTSSAACTALKSSLGSDSKYVVFNSGASGQHAHINMTGNPKVDCPCTTDTASNPSCTQ